MSVVVDVSNKVQCIEGIEYSLVGAGALNTDYNLQSRDESMTTDKTIRVVTLAPDGSMKTKDYDSFDTLESLHDRVGIDDCSTDLTLRGMPVFRGLIGPMPESKTVVRYESPDVFEAMTKEWSEAKVKRRRRRASVPAPASPAFTSGALPTMSPSETV